MYVRERMGQAAHGGHDDYVQTSFRHYQRIKQLLEQDGHIAHGHLACFSLHMCVGHIHNLRCPQFGASQQVAHGGVGK